MGILDAINDHVSDDLLELIASRFTLAHWTLLQVLACEETDSVLVLRPLHTLQPLTQIALREETTFSPQNFRVHLSFLEGAGAVSVTFDVIDTRRKAVSITSLGYRMLEKYMNL